jgi:hypothetical protein
MDKVYTCVVIPEACKGAFGDYIQYPVLQSRLQRMIPAAIRACSNRFNSELKSAEALGE